jgi:HlyD family secretion protein
MGRTASCPSASAPGRHCFELISASPIVAPSGSLVRSVLARPGAAVGVGTPVAEWIDCDVILVDVPVSDLEVGLLRKGMLADVVLEGETQVRQGSVLLTRGAASVLGSADLAALAKGRGDGSKQVILRLEHTPEDVAARRRPRCQDASGVVGQAVCLGAGRALSLRPL